MNQKNSTIAVILVIIAVIGISILYSNRSSNNPESNSTISASQLNSYISPNGYSIEIPSNYTKSENQFDSNYPPILTIKNDSGYLMISPGYSEGSGLEGWLPTEKEIVIKSSQKLTLVIYKPSKELEDNADLGYKIVVSMKTMSPLPSQFSKNGQIIIKTYNEDQLNELFSILESLHFDPNFSKETTKSNNQTVVLYYFDGTNYQSTTFSLSKQSQIGDTTLKQLFKVYLPEIASEYNSVTISNRIATVDFNVGARKYLDQATAGISSKYTNSIRKTLLQFDTIDKVQFSIDGKVITDWDA